MQPTTVTTFCDAIAPCYEIQPGTDAWYQAFADANEANSEHMAEDFVNNFVNIQTYKAARTLLFQFAYFEAAHVAGVHAVNEEPKGYVNDTLLRHYKTDIQLH